MVKEQNVFSSVESSFDRFSDLEKYLKNLGYSIIAGVDEAGRGAVAGPVFASAVILPKDFISKEIKDSKKLTPKKREELFEYICSHALSYAIAKVDVEEINAKGILKATFKAMYEAIKGLNPSPQVVLVDGPFLIPEYHGVQKAVIDGDNLCVSIAAASILAKVARDRYMQELSKVYPQYGFEKHKGYGTKLHLERIKLYGPCEVHRTYYRCFL
ncbi:ribonuclease HII [Thermodesulfobacterium sp. TA1]|uniref:ribonuclease HII n=1 Tax=Thermodesulfobacterium sp. TA1 TaxID=2234087 RepID=UPI0012327AB8|nr:ribonuclease HII [Thermodesulfobacterium sp. TA1]QER42314.1 ribonuclease HII [Thermodesulfobacterium sp. TA1]